MPGPDLGCYCRHACKVRCPHNVHACTANACKWRGCMSGLPLAALGCIYAIKKPTQRTHAGIHKPKCEALTEGSDRDGKIKRVGCLMIQPGGMHTQQACCTRSHAFSRGTHISTQRGSTDTHTTIHTHNHTHTQSEAAARALRCGCAGLLAALCFCRCGCHASVAFAAAPAAALVAAAADAATAVAAASAAAAATAAALTHFQPAG